MSPTLSFYLFGSPHIERDGQSVAIGRRKSMAMLAYLGVSGQGQSREALAAMFWPDLDQSRAFAYLRQALWSLNEALGEGWVAANRDSVELAPGNDLFKDHSAWRR